MAENTNNANTTAQPGEADAQAMPQMHIVAQYLKDLSFENPNAPESLKPSNEAPQIQIGVNVNANPKSGSDYEVDLKIEARGNLGKDVLFNIEVEYGGIVRLANVPQESVHPVVLIEGPRMLFPFVRQIIAEATRNGGFPPLMVDPIDFAALYQQRMMQVPAEGGADAPQAN